MAELEALLASLETAPPQAPPRSGHASTALGTIGDSLLAVSRVLSGGQAPDMGPFQATQLGRRQAAEQASMENTQLQEQRRIEYLSTLLDHALKLAQIEAAKKQDPAGPAGPDEVLGRQRYEDARTAMFKYPTAGVLENDPPEAVAKKIAPFVEAERKAAEAARERDAAADAALAKQREAALNKDAELKRFTERLGENMAGLERERNAALSAANATGATSMQESIQAAYDQLVDASEAARVDPSADARMDWRAAKRNFHKVTGDAQKRASQFQRVDMDDLTNVKKVMDFKEQAEEVIGMLMQYGDIGGPVAMNKGLAHPDPKVRQLTAEIGRRIATLAMPAFEVAGKNFTIHELRLIGATIPQMGQTLQSRLAALRGIADSADRIERRFRGTYKALKLDPDFIDDLLSPGSAESNYNNPDEWE